MINTKKLSNKIKYTGTACLIIGALLIIFSFLFDAKRAFYNYIIMYTFIVSIAVGALCLIAIEYMSGAAWSVPFRRVNEFLSSAIPFLIILVIPIIPGIHTLYHWSHKDAVDTDPVLQGKSPYLNETFFILRLFICILLWIIFYIFIIRNSRKQDYSKDIALTNKNIKISVLFAPFAVITLTLTSIDLIMSLEAHWYSTIFGIYYLAGTLLSGISAVTLISVLLAQKGYFDERIQRRHFHTFGMLMFALNVFWAYIAFSQYLLIWYADIPEETFWLLKRMNGHWQYFSISIIFIHFIIPFIVLISSAVKTNLNILKFMAIWLLAAHWLDLYWLVMPAFDDHSLAIGWVEAGFPIFIVGIFILLFVYKYSKVNIIPVGDPKLKHGIDMFLYPDLSID